MHSIPVICWYPVFRRGETPYRRGNTRRPCDVHIAVIARRSRFPVTSVRRSRKIGAVVLSRYTNAGTNYIDSEIPKQDWVSQMVFCAFFTFFSRRFSLVVFLDFFLGSFFVSRDFDILLLLDLSPVFVLPHKPVCDRKIPIW